MDTSSGAATLNSILQLLRRELLLRSVNERLKSNPG
jgi:hypothetical protein